MGVYLVALTVGVPCALFLLYCLTPKGKHWLRVNGMLCPSYLSIYQFIYFSRLSGSRYHKEDGPESHGNRMPPFSDLTHLLEKSVKIYNIRLKKCVEIVVIRLKKCIFAA